jgi:hypothetical protein
MDNQLTIPAIRRAPLGELKVYEIQESELNSLADGQPTSLCLNFASSMLSFCLAFAIALLTTDIKSDRTFIFLVCCTLITGIAGSVCLAFFIKLHQSTRTLVKTIRDRMPPPKGVQMGQGMPEIASATGDMPLLSD